MYLVDYHTHPYSHGEISKYNTELLEEFIKTAINNNIKEIGFSDHDRYSEKLNWNLIDSIKEKSPITILKGLEFDYIPGREDEIAEKIKEYRLDYAIGSVHYIGNWAFDRAENIDEYKRREIDNCYVEYFNLLRKAIKSNLFNIIGHFDLIKIFGYRPDNINLMEIINPVLEDVKKHNLVLELNTNGLNKPIREVYPSLKILEKAFELKIPITFGSDAHCPKRVGENIKKYAKIIRNIGYKEVAVFKQGNLSFRSF